MPQCLPEQEFTRVMTEMNTSNSNSHQSLVFKLKTLIPFDDPVFIAGNFNNWNAADPKFQFQKNEEGIYQLMIDPVDQLPDTIEYKYVRGNWNKVELDKFGNGVSNRRANSNQGIVEDEVPVWMNNNLFYNPKFLPQIKTISEQFEIPQLIKTRRITALVPHNYDETDKRYPVLYLQDGQNLFDDYAPFGNWGVDKRLALLAEQGMGDLIVIAIDHANEERIAEFTPSYRTRLGRGDGKKYSRFLADTLKPYVDKHFRTDPKREATGVGGSSMGALISIYAGMMYPEVFSKLMLFSPALWVAPNIRFQAINFMELLDTRVYLYAGGEESKNMVPNVRRFMDAFESNPQKATIEFELSIDPAGKHNEARWGEEFPRAIEWLFHNK